MPSVAELCADLADEHAALDAVVADLPGSAWTTATPAAGWDVQDTISHLCFYDEAAALALDDPEAFETGRDETVADVDLGREGGGPPVLLARWRTSRAGYLAAAATRAASDPGMRVPWFGPPMSIASFTTARLMETWAHGADVRDAVGVPLAASLRLRHVIHLGVTARPFAFAAHGVDDPADPIRVEAQAPDGTIWTWGPDDAADRVSGPALDLALLLTQRRHRSHTAVTATGPTAEAWLAIAQAFAGPPTLTDPSR
jgi:uncharacterized protein (TIGR03084 family)